MGNILRFASIGNGRISYEWGYEGYMGRRANYLCLNKSYARQYESLGDGITKHSESWPVAAGDFIDYCASLYMYLEKYPLDIKYIESGWPYDFRVTNQQLDFLYSLKYDDKKATYFNYSEMKSSHSASKQYDTRWKKVPEYQTGTFECFYRFALENVACYDALDQFALLLKVREYFSNKGLSTYQLKGHGIESENEFHDLECAFHSIDYLVKALYYQGRAIRVFDCLQSNYLSKLGKQEDVV